jgi:hypothetical protein
MLQGQIFHFQAGSSSLYEAHGASVEFQAPGYEGRLGSGYIGGRMEYGGVLRTSFHGYKLTAGDDTINFGLPTDIFNLGHYFYGRGGGLSKQTEKHRLTVFGGTTSNVLGAAFFQAGTTQDPFGLLFMESKLSDKLSFVSRSVITDKVTFINGLGYKINRGFEIGASGGVGASKPYFSGSFNLDRPKYAVKAQYVAADDKFRRISADAPLISEVDKENIFLLIRPIWRWTVSASRQNILSPVSSSQPVSSRALVHQASTSFNWFDFRLNGTVFFSESGDSRNRGTMFSASRNITQHVEAGIEFYRTHTKLNRLDTQSYTVHVREAFTQKLSLTQYVSRSNGQTSLNVGGEFNSGRFTIGVSHDTSYVPLRPAEVGGPFVRVYNVSLRFRPFRNLEVAGQTVLTPSGRVRYTAQASDYYYRYAGLEGGPLQSTRIGRFVVKGVVLDDDEKPVAGAALQIDGQVLFTDSEGRFIARFPRHGRESFKVLLDDFLTNAFYEVQSAPTTVDVVDEEDAKEIIIRLRTVTDPNTIKARQQAAIVQQEQQRGSAGPSPLE